MKELLSEFDINKDTFQCYTLVSDPSIKIMLFGKQNWDKCYIGFLINKHFHVLGLGSFSCINEDAKKLYVVLSCSFPNEEHKLKSCDYTLFDDEEQENIITALKKILINK